MNIMNNLTSLMKMESLELAQKAKVKWSIEGDKNSKYYHGVINKQRNNLAIRGINVDGVWIEEPKVVKNEFLSHFRDMFVGIKRLLSAVEVTVGGYGLQFVKERLMHYEKNKVVFTEKINVLNLEVKLRDKVLAEYTTNLEKAEKERDELKLTLEKLQISSKSLNTLLDSQSELLERHDNRSDKGYHEVLSPLTRNYIPPKYDLRLIDEHFESESVDVSMVSSSDVKTVDHKGVFSTEEPKPVKKNSFGPPIIKD
nr:RNA-directed DNA polymerase, eukaryota [Tanacetum cinerariifolium]